MQEIDLFVGWIEVNMLRRLSYGRGRDWALAVK